MSVEGLELCARSKRELSSDIEIQAPCARKFSRISLDAFRQLGWLLAVRCRSTCDQANP